MEKFSEGEWYPFRVYKKILLEDENWYFVLLDGNNSKHFLPVIGYEDYSIRPGEEVICRVDKINCTGRIYLEPKHPKYTEGRSYLFDVVEMKIHGAIHHLVVKDVFGNLEQLAITSHMEDRLVFSSPIRCVVKRIRKGRLTLVVRESSRQTR